MAAIIPIMLSTDIIPAGMTAPVLKYLRMKYAASKSETINAVANPATRCSGITNAAASSKTPVIEPAMIDAALPAFR